MKKLLCYDFNNFSQEFRLVFLLWFKYGFKMLSKLILKDEIELKIFYYPKKKTILILKQNLQNL